MRLDRTGPPAERARPTAPERADRAFSAALARVREAPRPPDGWRGTTRRAVAEAAALPVTPAEPRGGAAPAPLPAGVPPPPQTALGPLVRALPVAFVPSPLAAGAPLTIGFGRALDVDLRSMPSGVAIVLRPEGGLLGAAEAELPRVVEALRARGVAVARAEVAARGGGRRPR